MPKSTLYTPAEIRTMIRVLINQPAPALTRKPREIATLPIHKLEHATR